MKRFHPSPALVISLIALFVALGGTSYAAINALPRNSVGTPQLKKNAVTSSKIKNGAVTARKINPAGLTVPDATDSAQLGGVAASGYQRSSLPSGKTETGIFATWTQGSAAGGYFGDSVTFPVPLAADLDSAHVIFVAYPSTSATHCAGTGQAESGYLCLYERFSGNSIEEEIMSPTAGATGSSKLGFSVRFDFAAAGGAWSYGSWAVTAP